MGNDKNRLPSIVWLKVTDYMLPWLEKELGGKVRAKERKVLSVQHLTGAREILRMETVTDNIDNKVTGKSMSPMVRNCIDAGMSMDAETVEEMFGISRQDLKSYVPIECPKMCVTELGMIRPWELDVNFSRSQANRMIELLRREFWNAVAEFAEEYAREHEGEKYAQADMIEDFCKNSETPDVFVDAMRREWQRRCKRADG